MRGLKLQFYFGILLTFISFLVFPTKAFAVIQSLNSQTGQNQTFQNDSNVTISSLNNIHSILWQGLLPISRGGTGASSFTNGSIPFISNGIFSQDNSNLFWDNTNKRLGVGTSAPTQSLEVMGGAWIGTDLFIGPNTGSGVGRIWGNNAPLGSVRDGNAVVIEGGESDSLGGLLGGYVQLNGGVGRGNGSGGYVQLNGGYSQGSGNGGNINIWAGQGGLTGNTNGGNIDFRSGTKNGTGSYGEYRFINPTQTTFGVIDFSLLSGANKVYSFPNTSGTLGVVETNQTWSGLNKFEAASNSTIYVGSSVKSGCIVLGDSDEVGVTYITANDGVLTASATQPTICQ